MITKTISIKTTEFNEIINITNQIQKIVDESNIVDGQVILFVPHTTAAVTINENTDPDLKKDILLGLSKFFPNLKEFEHFENNSDAHIKASLISPEQILLVENKKLILGTWQGIYFCEFDGPRNRNLIVRIF
ncbi:secondary thiamine-phosphate synthase enzyme YjbQ [Candidatus Izemoplasma sp. B36]|uniref:secondary thiamine-phosphate synthase enzyme YjbQ n=1 Tax=Candidatus Izemoplasma sp. B36 TaxID=3242468 RepID=UPI0035560206